VTDDKQISDITRPELRNPEGAIPLLIAAFKLPTREVQLQAVQKLIKIGKPAVRPLIRALANEDERVWHLALGTLIKIGEPAVDDLVAALVDRHEQVRFLAAAALKKIDRIHPGNPSWRLMMYEYDQFLKHQPTTPTPEF
jgi:HEAT repeat protein